MTDMVDQPRVARVLVILLIAMTGGAFTLLLLEGKPVPAGAFSLSSYSQLDSIGDAVHSEKAPRKGGWNAIEISYTYTSGGNLGQIASLERLASADDLNFHFLVCTGRSASDGAIASTARWQKQFPCVQGDRWNGNEFTIRICVVGDDAGNPPTDSQIQRLGALVESLCRKFEISQRSVRYPDGWKY